jgi:hypothetical protein
VAPVSSAFTKRESAAQIFPYLARPGQLSSRFRVGGGNCLSKVVVNDKTEKIRPATTVTEPDPESDPEPPDEHCNGNCGKGKGNGGGNGTNDEGGGNDP